MDLVDLEERLDAMGPPGRVERFLGKIGARRLPLPGKIWLLDRGDKFIICRGDAYFYVQEADEWIMQVDLDELFPDADMQFHDDFWSSPATLYHATTPDRARKIDREGLRLMDESRGISNRGTGAAIFTTSDLEEASMGSYGEVIFAINTQAMTKRGLTPFVAEETPCQRYEQLRYLAYLLDLDMEFDIESGISPETVIVFEAIPARYLSRVQG